MFSSLFKNLVVFIFCLSLAGLGIPMSADAGIIGTDEYLALQDRAIRIERINDTLMQDRVREQLTSLGVDPEHAQQRVATLSDTDLMALDGRLQDLPAGGDILGLVVAAFLVILILELAGVTDLFPTIGPGKTK
jgi:hypothetical protein